MPRPGRRRGGGPVALLVVAAMAGGAYLAGRDYVRAHPERFPWTPLRLADPIGPYTPAKLAALGKDPAACRALLAADGAPADPSPPRLPAEPACAFRDGVWLVPGLTDDVTVTPRLDTACPVAAAMRLWVDRHVQPAARAELGSRVAAIETFGSYSCRRLYGRADGAWSEHASGDAIDIAGFRLADGRRVRVLADWPGEARSARFLRAVRDGACTLFPTVLSPDYNAAHRDHLHLDMADRGPAGWTVCR